MMKWFSLKQQNKDDSAPEGGRRTSATQLRIQKDVSELNHLDGYFKNGLWKANHSITCDKGAVNRLESREQCYIKANNKYEVKGFRNGYIYLSSRVRKLAWKTMLMFGLFRQPSELSCKILFSHVDHYVWYNDCIPMNLYSTSYICVLMNVWFLICGDCLLVVFM